MAGGKNPEIILHDSDFGNEMISIKDISKIVFDTSGGNGVMREFLNYVEN